MDKFRMLHILCENTKERCEKKIGYVTLIKMTIQLPARKILFPFGSVKFGKMCCIICHPLHNQTKIDSESNFSVICPY